MATSSSKPDVIGAGCLFLFGLPFAGIGMAAAGFIVWNLWTWHGMAEWVETPAFIEHVELVTHSGEDGDTYSVEARYGYTYEGVDYTGTRVAITSMADNLGFYQSVWQELDPYRESGRPFRCFVDPEEPESAILYRNVRWGLMGFASVFMFLFGGVGFGMVLSPFFMGRSARRRRKLEAAHPEAPWMWRLDWAEGAIRSSGRGGAIAMTAFAAFWNAIAFPVGILVVREALEEGNRLALIALIFPAIGLGLIAAAVYQVLQWRRYGVSVFRMAEAPGVIGGKLSGVIEVPRKVRAEGGFRVKLQCVHHWVTGSGKNSSTHEDVLWEDERVMARELLDESSAGTAIPVAFGIPYGQPDSDPYRSKDCTLWRLRVTAAVAGVDYAELFEVPVFKTAASSPAFVLDEAPLAGYLAERNVLQEIAEAGVRVSPLAGDGLRIEFPMARHWGMALTLTLIFVVFGGAAVGLWFTGAPLLFPIVFGFFTVLLGWAALDAWFAKYTVEIRRGEITAWGGLLGRKGPHRFAWEDMDGIETKNSATQGSTTYFALFVKDKAGKSHVLCKGIEGRSRAEMLKESLVGILEGTHNVA